MSMSLIADTAHGARPSPPTRAPQPTAAWRLVARTAAMLTCAGLAAGLLGACAAGFGSPPVAPGDSAETVRQKLGAPVAEHALADGQRRLEYSSGSYGRRALMVDLDAQGRVLRAENVRDEAHFNAIQAGITTDQLLAQLGAPSRVWGVQYRNQTVWSYRYESPFCKIFHVGISPQGVVEDISYGPDPVCDNDGRLSGLGRVRPH